MRTFFDIILGILATVLRTCLHGVVSTAGVFAAAALSLLVLFFLRRRIVGVKAAPSKTDHVIRIDR
jgi:hypothetical protein